MTLNERIESLGITFRLLQDTTSRNEKQVIIAERITLELQDDFDFCCEVLDGRHKLGWTLHPGLCTARFDVNSTIRQAIQYLIDRTRNTKSNSVIADVCSYLSLNIGLFIAPIVNRTLRLGIGRSILPPAGMAPMLAKKFEGNNIPWHEGCQGVIVTQKLDGNRCISWFDGERWQYQSRNTKPMNVRFDMDNLPTDRVYDGEILSREQVKQLIEVTRVIRGGKINTTWSNTFSTTSGLINRHGTNKDLIYCIFDILDDSASYLARRQFIDKIGIQLSEIETNVLILPVLMHFQKPDEFNDKIYDMLDTVSEIGGEGLMLNMPEDFYQHRRSDSLLKFKKVYTMDMRVIDVIPGTGVPGPGRDGAIEVAIKTDDGKFISCKVGSGLSKVQCEHWAEYPGDIIGKTVEIAYNELSKNKTSALNDYSLRFPRLKKVRSDKNGTSEY